MKLCIKINKKILKFGETEIGKHKFHQHESRIYINKIVDINKVVVANKVSFSKKSFKYFIGHKDGKKDRFYAYCSQNRVHTEEILNISIYIFLHKIINC